MSRTWCIDCPVGRRRPIVWFPRDLVPAVGAAATSWGRRRSRSVGASPRTTEAHRWQRRAASTTNVCSADRVLRRSFRAYRGSSQRRRSNQRPMMNVARARMLPALNVDMGAGSGRRVWGITLRPSPSCASSTSPEVTPETSSRGGCRAR